MFLRALGLKTDERSCALLSRQQDQHQRQEAVLECRRGLTGLKLSYAINAKSGETVVAAGQQDHLGLFKEIQKAKIEQVEVAANDLEGAYVVADVVDMSTGEVLIDANSELTTTSSRS